MKKSISFLLFYLFCLGANAQAFKVGDINCNYSVINHTFTTYCTATPPSNDSQAFSFDIDGDMINDISFSSFCNYSGSSSTGWGEGLKVSASSGIEFAGFASSLSSTVGLNNLSYGSPINSNSNWVMSNGVLFQYHNSFTTNFVWGQPVNPFYIGFRKVLMNDTIFGWIKTSSVLPGQIFSYGYKSVSDSVILPASTITNTITTICVSDSLALTATPSGGNFYGPGVSGTTFYSGSLSTGTYNIMYCLASSSLVCAGKSTQTINVAACTGINEQSVEPNSILIYPNPSNGEFEIKSDKKNVVTITNELGQLIKTVELNSGNNFSSKLTDLQSGVYFIGNNSTRQKVVVIK